MSTEPNVLARQQTPGQTAGASALMSLPWDLLEQSCRRIGLVGLIFASLWAFGLVMQNVVIRWVESPVPLHVGAWPMPGNLIAGAGLLLSLGMVALAGKLQDRPNLLLDLGLAFEVVTALLLGLMNQWEPELYPLRLSWIVVVILIYPTIVPNTLGKILVASLLAASMDPLGLFVTHMRGVEITASASQLVWSFSPTYLTALLAVVPVHVIRSLGRQVRRARELGSYKLGESLGSGGMGEVLRAEHRLLARPAAIKLIRPEMVGARSGGDARVAVERFKREAQAAATLRSPHTIELYDFGVAEDGTFYYVMELLDGIGLDDLVERFGPVEPERAAYLIQQVCDSLGEAHARGMIHRDIKPSNILTTRMGLQRDFVKVLDFGLVKSESGHDASLTAPNMTAGTPAYMAPEIAMGDDDLDHRADVYALGCVLYWLVTGQLVFDADNPVKMMHHHISEEALPPSQRTEIDLPDALEDLILDCLAKSADARPSTVEELGSRLRTIPFAEPWTAERAGRWWATHLPEATQEDPCNKGELAPAMSTA